MDWITPLSPLGSPLPVIKPLWFQIPLSCFQIPLLQVKRKRSREEKKSKEREREEEEREEEEGQIPPNTNLATRGLSVRDSMMRGSLAMHFSTMDPILKIILSVIFIILKYSYKFW